MVNVKFSIGNKILKVARWYTLIRVIINFILGTLFVVLSYTVSKDGTFVWPYFWTGLGFYLETLLVWVFRYFLYGVGLLVCGSAYNLSQRKAVTYLDYVEAKKLLSNHKITEEEFDNIEKEYATHEAGYID